MKNYILMRALVKLTAFFAISTLDFATKFITRLFIVNTLKRLKNVYIYLKLHNIIDRCVTFWEDVNLFQLVVEYIYLYSRNGSYASPHPVFCPIRNTPSRYLRNSRLC